MTLKKIFVWLRMHIIPNEHDREVKRWWSDGGDERLRYDYDLNSDSIVLDLGGYKGQWASDIYSRFNCRMMIFEPVKKFADTIEYRFKNNPQVEVFNFALGKNQRRDNIALCDDGSSIYADIPEKESIQFEDVAAFFIMKNIKTVDLMKINIEGGEYELMPRLFDAGLVKRIKYIQIQFHNMAPDSEMHMNNICRELAKTHSPTYQYKFVWENWVRRDR